MVPYYGTYLQFLDTTINATSIDTRSIEWLFQMNNRSTRFHHWVLLVMFDEFAQIVEFLPSAHIITVILYKTMTSSKVIPSYRHPF